MNTSVEYCGIFLCILILLVPSTSMPSDLAISQTSMPEEVSQILKMARETENEQVLSTAMHKLGEIGDEQAAMAFMEIFKSKVVSLRLRQTQFIAIASQFQLENSRVKEELVSLLQEMLKKNPERLDIILITGALAKYGDNHSMQYLLNEYQKSQTISSQQEEHFRDYIFEELCQLKQIEASQFVLQEVQKRHDVMLTLSAINLMSEANNPYALEIARKCIHLESEEFDLIEAQHYLRAIIKFGNLSDKEYLDHLSKKSEKLFGIETAKELHPLLMQAYESIKNRNQ